MTTWIHRVATCGFHLALVYAAALALTAVAAAQERVALVIGNGKYANANVLPNPPNDARAVAKALGQIGFDVTLGVDLTRVEMEDRLRVFLRKTAGAKIALMFYAGHGMQVDGRNYLIPVDAKLEAASDLNFETVKLDEILDNLNDPARASIIILDACRDNPLARSFARTLGATRSAAVPGGLAAYSSVGTGTLIAFATAPGQTALDGDGSNSPFTTGLIKYLNTPGLEVRQMLTRVRADVLAATRNRQMPWDNSSLAGDVYLAGPTMNPQPIPPPPGPAADEIAWGFVQGTTDIGQLRRFVSQYPSSVRRSEAESRINALEAEERKRIAMLPAAAAVPSVADMQRPIDNLFAAWRSLNADSYIAQWAPDGVKFDLKAQTKKTIDELAADRRRFFMQLSSAEANYRPTFRGFQNGIGNFDVAYSLSLHYRSGRNFSETACESYKVRQQGNTWVIIENQDYKPC